MDDLNINNNAIVDTVNNSTDNNDNVEDKARHKGNVLYIGAATLVIVVLIVGYSTWQTTTTPKGTLLLSLRDQNIVSSIYTYNFKDGLIQSAYISKNEESANMDYATLDHSKNKTAFIEQLGKESYIVLLNSDTGERDILEYTRNSYIQSLSWSPNDEVVAYSVQNGKFTEVADDWDIYAVTIGEGTQYITSGANPQFIADSELLILKKNGLYTVNLETKKDTLVFSAVSEGISVTTDINFDISDDYNYIVLTDPRIGKLFTGEILSISPFTIGGIKNIDITEVYSPQISPDNKHIAVYRLNELLASRFDRLSFKSFVNVLPDYFVANSVITDWVTY